MAKRFLVDLDLSTNELQNAVIQNASADPSGIAGRIYFNDGSGYLRVYDGSTWQNLSTGGAAANAVALTGDVTGSGSVVNNVISIATTIAANSVALGTDTTGNYVASVGQGNYILITGTPGEGWAPEFAVNAATASTVSTVVARDSSGDIYVRNVYGNLLGNSSSATIAAGVATNSVALGTDTTGNYVAGVTASTGVSITGTPGEGWTPVISIGQPVATSDSPTFAAITITGDAAVNGGDLTTTSTGTATLFNTNATTLNIGGAATTIGIGAGTGNTTVNNNLIVSGNLTVSGSVTTLDTQQLIVEDNIIVLNSNVTTAPSLDAGLEVERGTSLNVSVLWNETSDLWTLTNDGTNYAQIARKYAATISSSAATSYTLTHNLNTRDVTVEVYQNSSNYDTVEVDVLRSGVNAVTINFAASPSVDYRVVITG